MNSFSESIAEICGVELSAMVKGGKYTVYGNETAVIEGHGGISAYSDQSVSFFMGKRTLTVAGNNLRLNCIGKSFAVVRGDIQSVAVTK